MSHSRSALGTVGEQFGAWWLTQQGMTFLGHNLDVEGGEIDLMMSDRGRTVAVEVRALTGPGDPIDAIDTAKRQRVKRLAAREGINRVDFLGIGFRPWGVEIHWLPG